MATINAAIAITKDAKTGDILVAFPYHAETVARVKGVPGRKWVPERKVWSVPVASLSALMQEFEKDGVHVVGEIPELNAMRLAAKKIDDLSTLATDPIKPFDFKTKCFTHQIQGWNMGITRDAFLLGDDQGLGKTKQTIDILEYRRQVGDVQRVLVVAKATLKYNWANEIATHGHGSAVVIDGKNAKQKLEAFRAEMESDAVYVIVNYEQLRDLASFYTHDNNDKKVWVGPKNASDELGLAILRTQWDAVVLDEAHKVKNRKSRMGAAIQDLNCRFKYALTGTPIINRPEEMFNLLKWFGMERRGYWAFVKDYCYLGGYSGWEVEGYLPGAIDRMGKVMRSNMLRRTKSETLDIPEKIRRTVWVDLSPKQRKVYDQIVKEVKTELEEMPSVGMIALTKILRLKQAAGSLELLGGEPVSAKIDAVKELVDEMVESGQKVLVFTQFLGMYRALKRELADHGVVGIDGSMAPADRQAAVDAFQTKANVHVFVGMAQACREGLTLTAATNVVFVDKEWAPAYVMQAEDRAHRIGQKSQVLITNVLAKDTIDEQIEELLAAKGDTFDAVVNGNEEALDRAGIIRRLLV